MNAHTGFTEPSGVSGQLPALPMRVGNLIEEWEEKDAALIGAIGATNDQWTALNMACTVRGTYVSSIGSMPSLYESTLRLNLLQSGWQAVYNHLQVDRLATADDKKRIKKDMASPPPLTIENVRATFGDYFLQPRFHILRGLAEVFCSVDQAYKSHSKVRIGVKGLPKRLILTGWTGFHSGYARDKFADICNALAAYQGKPMFEWAEMRAIDQAHKDSEDAILDGRIYVVPARYSHQQDEHLPTVDRGLSVRLYQNGNVHIFFEKWALLDINRALAEFYGDVLPDAEPDDVKPSPSTAVSKDLQFYPSPPAVIDAALELAGLHKRDGFARGEMPSYRVLEPSCGDGRILDELAKRGYHSFGIEYHPGRVAECKVKGHRVLCANFLEQPPEAVFDHVVMNPPFYGKHWRKHIDHALKFLKPGGVLVAILPATAKYDDGVQGDWRDLPAASFSASGTNVPTGLLRIARPRSC